MAPPFPPARMAVCTNPSCNAPPRHTSAYKCVCGSPVKWVTPFPAIKRKRDQADDGSAYQKGYQAFQGSRPEKKPKTGHSKSNTGSDARATGQSKLDPSEDGKSISKTEAKPSVAWCFKCHVGSHWSLDCSPEREPKESNLAPAIGWQDHTLHPVKFATVQGKAPISTVQVMHHLWHQCVQIQQCLDRVKYRDQVLQKLVEQPRLIAQVGANVEIDDLPGRYRHGFEVMCAKANKAGHALMIEYANQLRMLYHNVIRAPIHPNKDRKSQSPVEKRQEMADIADRIANGQSKVPIRAEFFDDFRNKVGQAKDKYDTEMNTLDEGWVTLPLDALVAEATATSRTENDMKYLPTRGFRFEMSQLESWLPVLLGPAHQDSELLSQVFPKGIPKHLLLDGTESTEPSKVHKEMAVIEGVRFSTRTPQHMSAGSSKSASLQSNMQTLVGVQKAAELEEAFAKSAKTKMVAEKALREATQAQVAAENAVSAHKEARKELEKAQSAYDEMLQYEIVFKKQMDEKFQAPHQQSEAAKQEPVDSLRDIEIQDAKPESQKSALLESDQEWLLGFQRIEPLDDQQGEIAPEKSQIEGDLPLRPSDGDEMIE